MVLRHVSERDVNGPAYLEATRNIIGLFQSSESIDNKLCTLSNRPLIGFTIEISDLIGVFGSAIVLVAEPIYM